MATICLLVPESQMSRWHIIRLHTGTPLIPFCRNQKSWNIPCRPVPPQGPILPIKTPSPPARDRFFFHQQHSLEQITTVRHSFVFQNTFSCVFFYTFPPQQFHLNPSFIKRIVSTQDVFQDHLRCCRPRFLRPNSCCRSRAGYHQEPVRQAHPRLVYCRRGR